MRSRPDDVRRPEKVIVRLGQGWHCQLCGRSVPRDRAKHHLEHMLEFDAWLSEQEEQSGPKPDSVRRSFDRKVRRARQLDTAKAIGEEPFRVAVVGRDPGGRWIRRERKRRPRRETEARIRELHAQGRLRYLIAEELGLTEDYGRRVLKRIENGDGLPRKRPANDATMRPVSDLAVQHDGLYAGGDSDA